MKNTRVKKLVYTALLAAIAGVLMSLEISVPFFPPFYKLDFSDIAALIATFTMGPVSGLAVELLKIVIKLATVGTNSMYVGEVASVVAAFLYILPLWFVFKRGGKTKKSLIMALIVSEVIRITFACFTNAYISLPLYAAATNLPLNKIIMMVSTEIPAIKNLPTFIMLATIPFNFIKLTTNYILGYFLINRLHKAAPKFFVTMKEGK